MLIACTATGVISGLLVAHVRLHLGLPGHKALLWMTPIIFARLLTRSKPGATAGASAAAVTSLGLGANLAGGPWALPLIAFAGAAIDAVVAFLEKHPLPPLLAAPIIGATAMLANLLCFVKRLANPIGAFPHHAAASWWFRPLCYAAFGLAAGLIAATAAALTHRKQNQKQ
jgi:hypothetical protein